ncbi:carbohydrate kinase [Colwellia sp. D2M02]|uniref:carbohydrate kinase family protein n=1 Tax=Colwellia sp. D2M02 TaxID=2841562 RepID=UPI001C09071E|nr:carbohydrate kinase [Colwellia sp. D2M02]MBU2894910.1 carbohydrate kinase [Colwellia sp. D2M02]
MKSVICFGEALIDFLNTGKQEDGCLMLNNYRQYPGGAPANAAVAIAKLGGNAIFAGQVGNDIFGDFLNASMQAYHVDTKFLSRHSSAPTALAFVTLDQYGERSFSFYRQNSADVLFKQEQVKDEWFTQDTTFHFCSNTLTEPDIAHCTEYAVNKALDADAIVSFDVNLRHNLWPSEQADIDTVNNLVQHAHIIKFSLEEFNYLANDNPDDYLKFCLNSNCQLLIITDGANPIVYHTPNFSRSVQPPAITAIDTTAGGDGFIGGILFALSQFDHLSDVINNDSVLKKVIEFSAQCGAIAVSKSGAFPALATLDEVLPRLTAQQDSPSINQVPSLDAFLWS